MKLLILTTDTSHHTFFVSELKKSVKNIHVICEKEGDRIPPFEINHSFEEKAKIYEQEIWFDGKNKSLKDFCDPIYTKTINSEKVSNFLKDKKPDLAIIFGTSKINKRIIKYCPRNTFNLHGGDPEEYRGLDSHLWAIYHKDFKKLETTIHRLDQYLDNGEIVNKKKLQLNNISELFMLRSINTKVCIELSLETIEELRLNGYVKSKSQKKIGRYYSFMPKVLKEICNENFKRYINEGFQNRT